MNSRYWQQAVEALIGSKDGSNQHRWRTAANDKAFVPLLPRVIIETPGERLLRVSKAGTVSTNVCLRPRHNCCVDLNWLPCPLIPKRQWTAVKFKAKRAITLTEHQQTIPAEVNAERKVFYQLRFFPIPPEAPREGTRRFSQFVWMCRQIPGEEILVNQGGLAPAYRNGVKFPRIIIAEEQTPAWRLSELGLTCGSSGTSKGHRGIFLATHAPRILRLAEQTGDTFLHDIARSAVVGRYTSFPGYHMNTARTTVYSARREFCQNDAFIESGTTSSMV